MSARGSMLVRLVLLAAPLALFAPTVPRVRAQTTPTAHHAGQWTTPQTPWPGRADFNSSVWAVHMALLRGDTVFARPHSQILAWGSWSPTNPDGGLWAWNPATDLAASAGSNLTPRFVPPPPYNLFCAGAAAIPNSTGDLLVVSGTERGKTGAKQSARFSALDRTWLARPMLSRRWYGNATGLSTAVGKVVATAGNRGHHMVVFGGARENNAAPVQMNDVQRYLITNAGEWDPPLTDDGIGSDWPAPRESHTLTDRGTGPNYLFGGKDASVTRGDVWQLHLLDTDLAQSYRWRQLVPENPTAIPTRWRHAAVVAANPATLPDTLKTMYVHGGVTTDSPQPTTLDDTWKLEWRTDLQPIGWYWAVIPNSGTGAPPSGARSGHSMVWDKINNRAFLYGGQDEFGNATDPNLYVITFTGGVPDWKIATPAATTTVPAPRTRHAMAVNHKADPSTGVVFGGIKANGQFSDELWEFTVSTDTSPVVTWSQRTPGAGDTPPPARADASIIVYTEYPTSYVVLGGVLAAGGWDPHPWELRFPELDWQEHLPLEPLSQALRGHRAIPEQRLLTELTPEVYDADANTWSAFGQTKHRTSYHMMFLASDGMLYSPGPNYAGRDSTWRLSPSPPPAPGSGEWSLYTVITNSSIPPLDGTITGILYRPNLMMKCGGLNSFAGNGLTRSLPTGQSLPSPPWPEWRPSVNKMGESRADHYVSMLPTGEVIATGGWGVAGNYDLNDEDELPRRRPLIWNPDHTDGSGFGWWYGAGVGSDLLLAAEPVTRGHHSSAVILPDGRILSGGGWEYHPASLHRSVDQYSPPYLFQPGGAAATRARLHGAQEHITWLQDFKVACPDTVVQACLIRPGATTHAFNQDNRYVPLTVVSQVGHQVLLRIEGDRNYAPPGNYLLFVLRLEGGRKVPSIARWVNVGEVATSHATWDLVPPAVINDLVVTGVQGTSQTLQWTAPASDAGGTTGRVTRYEIRYRAGAVMSTVEEFFTLGSPVTNPPTPAAAGYLETFTVTGLTAGGSYTFRIISRDAAGHDRNWSALSNEAATPNGGSAGCPFVDTRTAGGWQVENSILGRSLTGALALDGYRLKHAPEVRDGRVRLRVRENEQERTTLDQLRLIAVDHAPGVRAYALGDEVLLGSRVAAARVTTSAGVDVTSLLNGSGAGFAGGPGDTLLVEFAAGEHVSIGEERSTQTHDPFHIDDGGKCPPDCGSPLRSADPMSASGVDAQVLGSSGILLQTPDGLGGWRTVLTRYPREHADEAVLEGLGHGPVRLVFVGRHTVRFVGRLNPSGGAFTARKLPLLVARHSRLGDVAAAMDTTGSLTSELAPGDTVHLEFGWPPVPEGQVRELLFLSHGVYTANLPAALQQVLPERFAIQVPRPNPFAGSTTLRFDLPVGRHVRLEVLDPQGRRVRTLANHALPAGSHAIEWDGRNEAGGRTGPGVYFYRFEAGEFQAKGRMTRVP